MVAEPVRETGDLRRVEHVVNRIEVETSRFLKEIVQRNGANQPGEDQPGDRVHQDSAGSAHRQSCRCVCCNAAKEFSDSAYAQKYLVKGSEKETQIQVGPPIQ